MKVELHALPFLTIWTVSISRRENLSNKLTLMRSSIPSSSERISTFFSFHNGFSVNSLNQKKNTELGIFFYHIKLQ